VLPQEAPLALSLDFQSEWPVHFSAWAFSHSPATLAWLGARVEERPNPRAVDKRRAEFLAGRFAAAGALRALGRAGPVLPDGGGAPIWPTGVVGAITHSAHLAAAAVCEHPACLGLGMDVELTLQSERADGLLSHVGTEQEMAELARIPDTNRGFAFALMFSAKESLYKCLHPRCKVFFGFLAARVSEARGTRERGQLRLELLETLSPEFFAGAQFAVQYVASPARVATLTLLTRA
jgi:enterobactin synthetase component D